MIKNSKSVFKPQAVKMHGLRYLFPLLYSVLILAGCVTSEDMGRLQYDVGTLKSEVKDLKKERTGGLLDKRLNGLEEEQKNTSKAVSDLFMQMQSLTGEFQSLNSRFEETRYSAETTSKEREALILQLQGIENKLAELEKKFDPALLAKPPAEEQKLAKETGGTEEQEPQQTNEPVKTSEKTGEIKNAYMNAYRAFKEDRFVEAREQFEALLKNYPENEYSDNTRFWLGETYLKEKNYEDAILAYEDLLKKNPGSEKVPAALLKQAMAFYELKDAQTGKIILDKIIENFPNSEQAKIARKKLSPPPSKKKR